MEIRNATIEDLRAIQELNKKLFEREIEKYDKTIMADWPLSKDGEEFYSERILGEEGCAFVLIDKEKIIGYLVGGLSKDEFYRNIDNFAELDDMYILEEHRGKGQGTLLYDKFIEWCKEKSVKRIKILVTAKNVQAIEFYKKKGLETYNITLERDI